MRVFSNESAFFFFFMSQLLTSGGQSIGASASALVLPMNIQDWFPLGLSSLISFQSKGLSRVFCSTQFKRINSLVLSFLYGPLLTSTDDYWNNIVDYEQYCWQRNSLLFETTSFNDYQFTGKVTEKKTDALSFEKSSFRHRLNYRLPHQASITAIIFKLKLIWKLLE